MFLSRRDFRDFVQGRFSRLEEKVDNIKDNELPHMASRIDSLHTESLPAITNRIDQIFIAVVATLVVVIFTVVGAILMWRFV